MQKIILTLSALTMLSGCTSLVESDPWIMNQGRAQIQEDQFTDTFETRKLNAVTFHAIGDYYDRFGNGPMNVVVSYDPQSKINTKSDAQMALMDIQNGLAKKGVQDINVALSEMRGSGDVSTTLVSFQALTASAPKGCGMMPGYEDPSADIPNDTNVDPTYRYGCTVETLLAKQIAKPSDLMGKQGFETDSDGRRAERVISGRGYYSDKENAELKGENATSSK